MSATPQTQGSPSGRRRRLIIIGLVIGVIAIAAGLLAFYLFFFGSEAPPAPAIDDAIRVLLPSPLPE